jgi:hypothetical protein
MAVLVFLTKPGEHHIGENLCGGVPMFEEAVAMHGSIPQNFGYYIT